MYHKGMRSRGRVLIVLILFSLFTPLFSLSWEGGSGSSVNVPTVVDVKSAPPQSTSSHNTLITTPVVPPKTDGPLRIFLRTIFRFFRGT